MSNQRAHDGGTSFELREFTPRVSVRHGLLVGLSADICVLVSSFLLNVLVSRSLGPEKRGVYILTIVAATLSAALADLGISTVAVTHASNRRNSLRELHGIALGLSICAGLIFAVVYLALRDFWTSTLLHGLDFRLLSLCVLGIPALLYGQIGSALLVGLGRIPILSAIRTGTTVLTLGLTGAVVWVTHGSTLWTVVAWLTGALLSALALAGILIREEVGPRRPTLAYVREVFSFGLRGYVGTISYHGFLRVDLLFVSGRLGSSAVGVYSLASVLAERISLAGGALYNAAASHVGGSSSREAAVLTARLVRLLLLILVPLMIALALTARPLIVAIFGKSFHGAALPFSLLLPGTVCLTLYYVVGLFVISSLHRPGVTTIIQGCALVVSLPLYYFSIEEWGLAGGASVSSLIYALVTAGGVVFFLRQTGLGRWALIPSGRDVRDLWRAARRIGPSPAAD